MATIKSRIVPRGAAKPAAEEGADTETQIANLKRELAEERMKKSETEKLADTARKRAEIAEAQYVSEKINRALHGAAIAANAHDADDVVELVRSKGARIEGDKVVFGQGETVKDALAFVSEFVKGKPHLQKAQAVAQGSGSSSTAATSAPVQPPPVVHDMNTNEGRTAALRDRYRAPAKAQ